MIQREDGICPKSHKAPEKVGPRRQLQRLSLPNRQRLPKTSPNLMTTVPNKERVGANIAHAQSPKSVRSQLGAVIMGEKTKFTT